MEYMANTKITRRILEFPPVESDQDLKNFQKLIGKMWIELEPIFLNDCIAITDDMLRQFEEDYPFAYFRRYGSHVAIDFKQDYLEERNLCIGFNGQIQRKR